MLETQNTLTVEEVNQAISSYVKKVKEKIHVREFTPLERAVSDIHTELPEIIELVEKGVLSSETFMRLAQLLQEKNEGLKENIEWINLYSDAGNIVKKPTQNMLLNNWNATKYLA